jgi:alpha-ketoglutarate-dependent 2,4-dichlorophenoxyacetate dioxygenase
MLGALLVREPSQRAGEIAEAIHGAAIGAGIVDFSNVDPAGKPLSTASRAYLFKLADQLWHSDSSFKAIRASYSLRRAGSAAASQPSCVRRQAA